MITKGSLVGTVSTKYTRSTPHRKSEIYMNFKRPIPSHCAKMTVEYRHKLVWTWNQVQEKLPTYGCMKTILEQSRCSFPSYHFEWKTENYSNVQSKLLHSVADPGISKLWGGPDAVEFLGSENGFWEFDALSHIFYVFVVGADDKIDIVNTACCCLQWKYMRVIPSKFTKTNPPKMPSKFTKTNAKKFVNGGRAPGAPVLDPPLALINMFKM